MKTKIIISVYYTEIDGKKIIDEDSIKEEFENELKELLEQSN